ncbi:MAG: Leucine-rich repeat (LRR) protein [Maribacter sp.]|jgi:Leucine-rich repeat (LRR) protein
MLNSSVVSKIMSGIPSRSRAYSLEQAIKMGENCLFLVLDARIHRGIPKEVFGLEHLLVLSVQGIRMDTLNEGILQISQLKVLNMMGCGTTEFPLAMKNLPLDALFLSDGQWNEIPDWIFNLKELKSLTINNYELNNIPNKINKLVFLKELNLNKNLIQEININLKELKKIDFSHNEINLINDDFYLLHNLRYIDLSNNLIELISSKIELLDKLNHLNLAHNKLKKIPENISNFNLLSYLFLNNNSLEKIPEELFLIPLSKLNISNNNLKEIPSSIAGARRLREFNLSKNQIGFLPTEFHHLQQLESLDFSKNPIQTFPLGILGCNRVSAIKGMNLVLDISLRKLIIPFIQAMNRDKIPFDERQRLWTLFVNIESITNRKNLIRLLNTNFRPFKKAAIEKLLQPISDLKKEDMKHIYLVGKFKQSHSSIKQELLQNNSNVARQFSMENTHILVGSGRYDFSINENWKGVFLNEEMFIQIFGIERNEVSKELNSSAIDNIKKLLASKKENQELALQLLENHETPNELITLIYFIMVTNEDTIIRLKARNILKKKGDEKLLQFSKKDFNKEYSIDDILNEKMSTKINKKELVYLLFNHYGKGWKFIHTHYDKNILNKIESPQLNLSHSNLLEIILELKNIKNIKNLNLSHNKLIQIKTEDIEKIKQFSEINLSNNPLEYISEELLQLDNLRILHLKNCNDFNTKILAKKANWITVFR